MDDTASYAKTMCYGCGEVLPSILDHLVHVSRCAEPVERGWACWSCAVENWKTTVCRGCGAVRPDLRPWG